MVSSALWSKKDEDDTLSLSVWMLAASSSTSVGLTEGAGDVGFAASDTVSELRMDPSTASGFVSSGGSLRLLSLSEVHL